MPFRASAEDLVDVLGITEEWWCSTAPLSEVMARGVSVDSRELHDDQLFVARKGAVLDSHQLLGDVVRHASICIVEKDWFRQMPKAELLRQFAQPIAGRGVAFLAVSNTTLALGSLARYWRRELNLKTVAVTGSNGKTSTKELLQSLLTQLVGKGCYNIRSFNNHVGLPLTILSSSAEDTWLVLEAGMNHAGELDYLGGIAEPDVGVVLNIGPVHIESFGSLHGIADAKCELLAHVRETGSILINGDDYELDQGVRRLQARLGKLPAIWTFTVRGSNLSVCPDGAEKIIVGASEVKSLGLDGCRFRLVINNESADTTIPHVGEHHVYNALASVGAAKLLFPHLTVSDFARVLPLASRADWRFQWEQLGETVLINDAYNANPISMKGAVETVGELAKGRPLALILGDMLELGHQTLAYHEELGEFAARAGATLLVGWGPNAQAMVARAKATGVPEVLVGDSPEGVANVVCERGPFAFVLIKGSRGMQLERVVDAVRGKLSALSSANVATK